MGPDLARRLLIKPGAHLLVLNAPEDYRRRELDQLPSGVRISTAPDQESFDIVHLFVRNRWEVDALAPAAMAVVRPGGVFWISYPKRSARVETDVARDAGWETMQGAGWRPVSQVAVDATWSAMRFRPLADVTPRSR